MIQQGNLFVPKPQPSGEGRYVVAYERNGRWWNISRDHRFMTIHQAAIWLLSQRHLHALGLEVKLLEEINKV